MTARGARLITWFVFEPQGFTRGRARLTIAGSQRKVREPEGGPTGLFTIYDGSTLRKGEFTFSVAYSNYDRDPGNADITDWIAQIP